MGIETTLIDAGLEPLIEIIRPLVVKVSFLIGGIFGAYLILILVRVYYEHKKVLLLEDIKYDLDRLNIHYGLRHSGQKKSHIMLLLDHWKHKWDTRSVHKGLAKMRKKNGIKR
jgi:hypothetical protein